jgi:diguanylate cyclase (GGDEF)-like protein
VVRPWQIYVMVFVALAGAHLARPEVVTDEIVLLVGAASCAVAMAVGVRRYRPASPMPWYVMTCGVTAAVVGEGIYALEQLWGTPAFRLSDLAHLSTYPLVAAGVLLMIRAQRRAPDVAGLVDSLIVTVGMGLLSWAFIAGPVLAESTSSRLGTIIAVAYPAGDILILGLLVRLVTGQGTWSPAFRLLVGAALTLLAADTGVATSWSSSEYAAGLDLLWLASYALWGAAALHPDMVNLAAPGACPARPFSGRRMIILSGVVLLPVALLLAQEIFGLRIGLGTLVLVAAALSLLVMARMACAIDEIRLTTRQRDGLQDDLFRRATQDEVTGLANRPSFVLLARAALERSALDGLGRALIVVEVRGVDQLEQRYGHAHADLVLAEVARRIADVDRSHVVASIGPRQFGILVERLGPQVDLPRTADKLLAAAASPVTVDDRSTSLEAYAGVAVGRDGNTDAEVLMRDAALATASASASGHSRVESFDSSLREELTRRNDIETGLQEALREGHLEVFYQPLLRVSTRELSGYEALVRWNRPHDGMAPPDSFIPTAEKSDLICDIDRWVLGEATTRLAAWVRADPAGCAELTVSVNVSARNLASATIVDDVAEALQVSGLAPAQLTVEITETVLVDVPRAAAQMAALRELGVSISIDDFGTGYTSIGQLAQLPADAIKVDRSLVASDKAGARELLALIVQAGHATGLQVVAEGIEDHEQLATVTDLRYDIAQGYLIGRPGAPHGDRHPDIQLPAVSPAGAPASWRR